MIAEVSNMLIQPKDWIKVMCQDSPVKVGKNYFLFKSQLIVYQLKFKSLIETLGCYLSAYVGLGYQIFTIYQNMLLQFCMLFTFAFSNACSFDHQVSLCIITIVLIQLHVHCTFVVHIFKQLCESNMVYRMNFNCVGQIALCTILFEVTSVS